MSAIMMGVVSMVVPIAVYTAIETRSPILAFVLLGLGALSFALAIVFNRIDVNKADTKFWMQFKLIVDLIDEIKKDRNERNNPNK